MNLENLVRSLENNILDDEEVIVTGEHEGVVSISSHGIFFARTVFSGYSKRRTLEETSCSQRSYSKALAPAHCGPI
jgi:hypothetical protein